MSSSDALAQDIRAAIEGDEWENMSLPLYIGRYVPGTGTVHVMPDGIETVHRQRGLYSWESEDMARLTLIHELVHALDDQHSRMMSLEEKAKLKRDDVDLFFIRRALEEGHARHVSAIVARRLGIQDSKKVMRGFSTSDSEPDALYNLALEPLVKFVYEDGARFIEALYQSGGPELIRETFESPPLWYTYIREPALYLQDLKEGFLERQEKAHSELEIILKTEGWHGLLGSRFFIDPGPDFLNDEPLASLDWDETEIRSSFITFCRGFAASRPMTLDELIQSDTTTRIVIRLWRFHTPSTALGYLKSVKSSIGDITNLETDGNASCKETPLDEEGNATASLYERVPLDDAEGHTFDVLGSRGKFVMNIQGTNGTTADHLKRLWASLDKIFLRALESVQD